jgi:putative transposon-encoded protein
MKKETGIQLTGFEMLEKKVNKSGNSGRVYVPKEWIGKRVKIILIEK